MLIRRRILIAAVWWALTVFMTGGVLPVYGQTSPDPTASNLLIKIRNIDQMLQDLEVLLPSGPDADTASQTAMIRGMLQGTEWIDPSRSIVAGMQSDGQETSWLVFVPFKTPNQSFQEAYGAIAGEDYYVMRFPPAPGITLSDQEHTYFAQTSRHVSEANIQVEVAVHDVLRQSESQVTAAIQAMAANTTADDAPGLFTPEETQRMVRDLVAALKQIETLRLGLTVDNEALLFLLDMKGTQASYLSGLLTDQKTDVRLGAYQPDYPMTFRSRAYNIAGVMQILGASFGQFYNKLGFDFDELATISKGLTGEMAGGMALDQDGMNFEMIYVLHDTVNGEDYLTQTYLPWFEKYNLQMAALMEEQTGQPVTPLYERMPDTTVAGKKVIGVRTRFPAMTASEKQAPTNSGLKDYQTRMTVVGDLILAASSEASIARLINQADGFQKAPAEGPLAAFSMDMGAYLQGLQLLMSESGPSVEVPADIGALTMQASVQEGELTTRTRINVQDIQRITTLFASIATAMDEGQGSTAVEDGGQPESGSPQTAVPDAAILNTPAYWMDRGGLQSAYGNYKGAVRSYQKALELAPDLAEAHFQQGVAYGERGQYDAAVNKITRAIDLMPTNGAYFYGRARVYLLAGDEDLAMKDFMEAGFLGNTDARVYLKAAGVEWN